MGGGRDGGVVGCSGRAGVGEEGGWGRRGGGRGGEVVV